MKRLVNNYSYLILIIGIFFLCLYILAASQDPILKNNYDKIIVEQGDTVWYYAQKYKGKHDFDSVSFINWVEHTNYIDASRIRPGQEIIIPVELNE